VEAFYGQLKRFATLELRRNPDAPVHFNTDSKPLPSFISEASSSPVEPLKSWIETHRAGTLLVAETAGRREALIDALQRIGLTAQAFIDWQSFEANPVILGIATAPIDRGMYFGPNAPCLIAEAQLYGQKVAQRRRRSDNQNSTDEAFRHINELHEGTPVVHLEHGVGRYEGLQTLTVSGETSEFITLTYAESAKLYVPVASLHLISRYAGADGDSAPLHRLGSDQWEKARRKASERASDVAAQLLEVYARREARKGFAHDIDPLEYERFCAGFPFEETPDQASTIDAVRNDMCAEKVMDRLVCGDVGFGKTEVAMRAAFISSQNGKQVAVLVPTTLLAQQHYHSFCDRFAGWETKVAVVSRFNSASQNKAILADVAAGKIDILVGTHKLLSPDVKFNDLGLLIIDEEHRFGVKQKETLKALRTEVDILTLTATPIPRTLNMALGGMRDLSVIATPPAKRLSIKTFVREHNVGMIKEAILRETLRGGQVYYLHNEVKTIDETARKLQALVPDLKIAVAHGQQHETELERIMSDFYHQRFHILVCTTIIETGIDVPNANTIIMDRADRLGLAQLHQLRGRVGRSHHQAYAYLLCPPRSGLTKDAEKRLEAIEAAGDLGAGYLLATQDLEIRGAGELLGDDQSGQIHSVGFSLYLKMLERAVAALKRGELPNVDTPLEQASEVNLHSSALIPEDYLPDINTRLVLYRRAGAAQTQHQLRDLQIEMIDRFGLLPEPVKTLFISAEVRIEAEQAGVSNVDIGETNGSLQFMDNTKVDPLNLVTLVQKDPKRYQLAGANKLKFQCELTSPRDRADFIITLCKQLTQTRAVA
jgi:transcription-repair coupling factor (superfamily II helicase)